MRPLLLLLAACTADPAPAGKADTAGPGDTDGATDTDPDPDTDPDTDTGEAPAPPPALAGQLDLSGVGALPDGLRVALVPVLFGEGPRLGAPVAHATPDAAGAFVLQHPEAEPALSDRYQVGEAQPLDVSGATYAVVAYAAGSPDAPWQDGDALLGASLSALLVWLDETAPEQGWPAGWSLVDAGLAGTYGEGRCLLDTEVPLQWATDTGFPVFSPVETGLGLVPFAAPRALSLDVPAAAGVAPGRVAALPYAEVFQGESGVPPAFDVPLDGSFVADLSPAPGPDSLLNPSSQLPYSLFVPLRTTDADGSGGWSAGDGVDGTTVCDPGGVRVMLRHTPAPTAWAGLKLMDCQGGRGGWTMVRRSEPGTWSERLDATEVAGLRMDPAACSW